MLGDARRAEEHPAMRTTDVGSRFDPERGQTLRQRSQVSSAARMPFPSATIASAVFSSSGVAMPRISRSFGPYGFNAA